MSVLAGMADLRSTIHMGAEGVARAVRQQLVQLMNQSAFVESIAGHFEGHATGQERARRVLEWLRTL